MWLQHTQTHIILFLSEWHVAVNKYLRFMRRRKRLIGMHRGNIREYSLWYAIGGSVNIQSEGYNLKFLF